MSKARILVAIVWLALAGCDRFGFGQQDAAAGNTPAAAAGNAITAEASPSSSGVSDAGITRSRSLAGLTGGGEGGKDPGAIPAAAQGMFAPAMLVGRWSDDGNCKLQFEFFADGSFRTFEGVEGGWSLEGDRLTLTGAGDPLRVTLRTLDAERLVIANPDGTTGRSTRC